MEIKILNDIESKSLKDIWKALELSTSIDKSDKIHIFKTAIFYHTVKDVFKLSLPINDVYKILDMRCDLDNYCYNNICYLISSNIETELPIPAYSFVDGILKGIEDGWSEGLWSMMYGDVDNF